MSSRELQEWRILAAFERDVADLVKQKVPVEVASEMVLAAGEE